MQSNDSGYERYHCQTVHEAPTEFHDERELQIAFTLIKELSFIGMYEMLCEA